MSGFNEINKKNKYFKELELKADVSIVNALRRICLANISTYVIKEDDITISSNTSRFNNEIIKQRIQCIPVHILDVTKEKNDTVKYDFIKKAQAGFTAIHPDELSGIGIESIESIILKVDETNKDKASKYVTTGHIKLFQNEDDSEEIYIKRGTKDKPERLADIVFPRNEITNDHIVIARLKPAIESGLSGETLQFTAKFSLGTAKENGSFNVVSTCTYENKVNTELSGEQWGLKEKEIEQQDPSAADDKERKERMERMRMNWDLLDGRREQYRDSQGNVHNLCVKNCFIFKIETVGVYSNIVIWHKACNIMKDKCDTFCANVDNSTLVKVSHNQNTTQPYEYYVTLHNEDYTLGNPLVHFIYTDLYEKAVAIPIKIKDTEENDDQDDKDENKEEDAVTYNMKVTFVGFKVPHPHIPDGIIRIIYENENDSEEVDGILDTHKAKVGEQLKKETENILKESAKKTHKMFQELMSYK
jgi:DNA-directed RNA polymerase subunit L